jgi:hypothetical protein
MMEHRPKNSWIVHCVTIIWTTDMCVVHARVSSSSWPLGQILAISIYYRIGRLRSETQRFGSHERVTFIHGKANWDQLIQCETVGRPGSGSTEHGERRMKLSQHEKNKLVTYEPQLVFDQRQKLVIGKPWVWKNSKFSSLTVISF